MNDLFSHLGPGTEFLREAFENKKYDEVLYIIENMKERQKLNKDQINFIDELKEEIIRLKDLI